MTTHRNAKHHKHLEDIKFWKDNPIIKRPQMEEQVMKMFGKENIFSNMSE